MANAFLLRFRLDQSDDTKDDKDARMHLMEIATGYCLPFPSSYRDSKYFDCFPRRVWNNLVLAKLEMMKLLGRYSQQQGLYGRECTRMHFTAETWGFLGLQFANLFGEPSDLNVTSNRLRIHRLVESGLVVKAARIQRECSVMRFATKDELLSLSRVFGESVTMGQRCRLPKISSPKALWINDVVNVVSGSDVCEPVFCSRTPHDGIDLEFDGISDLFITIRYTRYAYTQSTLDRQHTSRCDPLLLSLICRSNPHVQSEHGVQDFREAIHTCDNDDSITILHDSEFEDDNGCIYRVITINTTEVNARCCYPPKRDNVLHGSEKSFDLARTKDLIRRRLNG